MTGKADKMVRVTVDLRPADYQTVVQLAQSAGTTNARVLRDGLELLAEYARRYSPGGDLLYRAPNGEGTVFVIPRDYRLQP